MIEYKGFISSKNEIEQIYFLKEDNFLYIGITEHIIVNRWGNHFTDNGSFRRAVELLDNEYIIGSCEVFFYAYNLSENLKCIPKIERRRALQHIEHEVHLEAGRRILLGVKHRIVSDTVRTAPTDSALNELVLRSISMEICDDLEQRMSA